MSYKLVPGDVTDHTDYFIIALDADWVLIFTHTIEVCRVSYDI